MSGGQVSVVVPTHNRAELVGDAVESVLAQTYRHCHVIVVDDGSTDDTDDVIRSRFGGESRVRYLRQERRGGAAARNAGLAVAQGEYIAFLDPGDVMRPWKLELQVACLERLRKVGVGMLWTDHDVVDDTGALVTPKAHRRSYDASWQLPVEEMFLSSAALREVVRGVPDPGEDTRLYWGDVYPSIAFGNLCATPSVLLARSRVRAVGGFDESLPAGEEHDFHLRACAAGPAGLLDVASLRRRVDVASQADELARARTALQAVLSALEHGADRLRLDAAVVAHNLAELHRRIARACVASSNAAGARRHLVHSLAHEPRQLGTWIELARTFVP